MRITEMTADDLEKLTQDDVLKIKQDTAMKIADLCASQSRYAVRWGYDYWFEIPKTESIYNQMWKEEKAKDKLLADHHLCDCLLGNRENTLKIKRSYENKTGIFAGK